MWRGLILTLILIRGGSQLCYISGSFQHHRVGWLKNQKSEKSYNFISNFWLKNSEKLSEIRKNLYAKNIYYYDDCENNRQKKLEKKTGIKWKILYFEFWKNGESFNQKNSLICWIEESSDKWVGRRQWPNQTVFVITANDKLVQKSGKITTFRVVYVFCSQSTTKSSHLESSARLFGKLCFRFSSRTGKKLPVPDWKLQTLEVCSNIRDKVNKTYKVFLKN